MKRKTVWVLMSVLVVAAFLPFGCKPIPYYLQQVCKVYGTATDSRTGDPLESVEVSVSPYQYSELTNSLGDYELEMAVGTWTVTFTKDGYETYSVEVPLLAKGDRVEVNAALVSQITAPTAEQIHEGAMACLRSLIAATGPLMGGSAPLPPEITEDFSQFDPQTSKGTILITFANYVDPETSATVNGPASLYLEWHDPDTTPWMESRMSAVLTLGGLPVSSCTIDTTSTVNIVSDGPDWGSMAYVGSILVDGFPADFDELMSEYLDLLMALQ
jgi:hypothetical protein